MGNIFNIARATGVDVHRDVLNEAVYFGKTKEAIKLESLIGELQASYKTTFPKDPKEVTKKLLPIIRKIETHMESMFNASDVIFEISTSTMAIKSYIRITDLYLADIFKSRTITSKDGIRFREGKNKILVINIGVEHLINYTAGECTAMLLHEVGHSMYQSIIGRIVFSFPLLFVAPFMEIIMRTYSKLNSEDAFKSFMLNLFKGFLDVYAAANTFLTKLTRPFTAIFTIQEILPKKYKKGLNIEKLEQLKKAEEMNKLGRLINAIAGYDDEKFSDNFATAYGYGTELSTALNKFNGRFDTEEGDNEVFIYFFNSLIFMNDMINHIVNQILYPHPSDVLRIKAQVDYLKKAKTEMNNPKMQNIIDEDIKALEKILKEIPNDEGEYWFKKMEASLIARNIKLDYRELVSVVKFDPSSPLAKLTEDKK